MHRLIVLTALTILSISAVHAAPAVTTANVYFRGGPGTGYASMGTLPQGSRVDLGECDQSGAWCAVTAEGKSMAYAVNTQAALHGGGFRRR